METRIVIFLAFVSIALITNTLLIFFVYKALAGFTSKVTTTVSEFAVMTEMKDWMSALQTASERAVDITEATKVKMAESQPVVENAQKNYRAALQKVDSTMETVADQITTNAKKAKDVVSGPAFSFLAFAAGLAQRIENIETEE
jgi:membrane-anchored protein YejM (alkaline phosphatase superfamily)